MREPPWKIKLVAMEQMFIGDGWVNVQAASCLCMHALAEGGETIIEQPLGLPSPSSRAGRSRHQARCAIINSNIFDLDDPE